MQTSKEFGVIEINVPEESVVSAVSGEAKPFNKIKGLQVDISIDTSVKPVWQPYRRIPVPLEKAVDEKIEELLRQDIIEAVDGHSNWVSPLVVVPKPDSNELYADRRRHAAPNETGIGNKVFVKELLPAGKLATKNRPEEFTVIDRKGSELLVKSDVTGNVYRRNVVHTKRIGEGIEGQAAEPDPVMIQEAMQHERPRRQLNKPERFQAGSI